MMYKWAPARMDGWTIGLGDGRDSDEAAEEREVTTLMSDLCARWISRTEQSRAEMK
jgi:hypothetical protein